jgi:hypothetical protein
MAKSFRTFLQKFSSLRDTTQQLSPSLVQLAERLEKLCETGIAMSPRCATIGTVQEISF